MREPLLRRDGRIGGGGACDPRTSGLPLRGATSRFQRRAANGPPVRTRDNKQHAWSPPARPDPPQPSEDDEHQSPPRPVAGRSRSAETRAAISPPTERRRPHGAGRARQARPAFRIPPAARRAGREALRLLDTGATPVIPSFPNTRSCRGGGGRGTATDDPRHTARGWINREFKDVARVVVGARSSSTGVLDEGTLDEAPSSARAGPTTDPSCTAMSGTACGNTITIAWRGTASQYPPTRRPTTRVHAVGPRAVPVGPARAASAAARSASVLTSSSGRDCPGSSAITAPSASASARRALGANRRQAAGDRNLSTVRWHQTGSTGAPTSPTLAAPARKVPSARRTGLCS